MITALGQVLTADGLSAQHYIGSDWSLRMRGYAVPGIELRSQQPSRIAVNLEHEDAEEVGRVVSLFRNRGGAVWASAVLDAPGVERLAEYPEPIYFSARSTMTTDWRDVLIEHLALCTKSATLSLPPVTFLPGSIERSSERFKWSLRGINKAIVEDAVEQLRHRGRGAPLFVGGETFVDGRCVSELDEFERRHLVEDQHFERQAEQRPRGPLRYRPCTILRVS